MPTDRFAEQQLIDCLERLSPEARERLGVQWVRIEDVGGSRVHETWFFHHSGNDAQSASYSDHAAVLAEVEGALVVEHIASPLIPRAGVWQWYVEDVDEETGDVKERLIGSGPRFAAAYAAFMEVCNANR